MILAATSVRNVAHHYIAKEAIMGWFIIGAVVFMVGMLLVRSSDENSHTEDIRVMVVGIGFMIIGIGLKVFP